MKLVFNRLAFLESELHERAWSAGKLPKLRARQAYKRALERGGPQSFLK